MAKKPTVDDARLILEQAILGSKAGRAQYAKMEPRVNALRPKTS